MGRIGKVVKSFIDTLVGSGNQAQFTSVEEFSGGQKTAQVFGPCNEDFSPPENCETLDVPIGRDRGYLIAAAYNNQQITPVALPGERRLYSTDADGSTVKSEIHLQQDGTIVVQNDNATVEISPAGVITFTGTKAIFNNDVDIIGNLDITGTITGSNVFGGSASDAHTHEQGNDSNGDVEQDTGPPK